MDQQEILNTILLTRLNYFSLAGMLELYRKVGSATLIMEHKNNLRDILPDASDKLVNAIQNSDEARKRAEVELEYDLRYGIEPLTMNDERYPSRLKECDDAPLMLFYKGNANLNQQRVINIVGTRHCTPYGEDLIRREGLRSDIWVLMDFGCVIVHVFTDEARKFYNLERLWSDSEVVDPSSLPSP